MESPVILSTENVALDQFLCEFIKDDEMISVDANWLQSKLRELEKLKRENSYREEIEKQNERNLNILKSRLDNMTIAMDIMKLQNRPRVVKNRVLDVRI